MKTLISLIIVGLVVALTPKVKAAQPSVTAGGIAVSPAIEQLQLTPGQDSVDFTEKVINRTDKPIQLKVGFNDFKALNQSGGVAFLGQETSDLQQKHGLLNWVRVDTQQIGLEPGESAPVIIHLTDLQSLPAGGHYGAVTYQVLPSGASTHGNRVTINQVLSSLVFLVTTGGGNQQAILTKPEVDGLRFSLPASVDLLFTNNGNAQTAPRGSLVVYAKNPAQPAASSVINSGSALVLPGSTRLLVTPLTASGHPWWPRHYNLQIRYRADNASKFSTYTARFFYVNPIATLLTALILAIAVSGVYLLFKHRQPVAKKAAKHVRKITNKKRTRAAKNKR